MLTAEIARIDAIAIALQRQAAEIGLHPVDAAQKSRASRFWLSVEEQETTAASASLRIAFGGIDFAALLVGRRIEAGKLLS